MRLTVAAVAAAPPAAAAAVALVVLVLILPPYFGLIHAIGSICVSVVFCAGVRCLRWTEVFKMRRGGKRRYQVGRNDVRFTPSLIVARFVAGSPLSHKCVSGHVINTNRPIFGSVFLTSTWHCCRFSAKP